MCLWDQTHGGKPQIRPIAQLASPWPTVYFFLCVPVVPVSSTPENKEWKLRMTQWCLALQHHQLHCVYGKALVTLNVEGRQFNGKGFWKMFILCLKST